MEKYSASVKGEKFQKFYQYLCEGQSRCNLTSIIEKEACEIKHFLDSLAAEKYFPQNADVIEIGSGAGFPSIPLMLYREDLSFTLVESIAKKANFLQETIEKLQLNAKVYQERAEVFAKDPAFREKFTVCTARAVAKMVTLVEYCLPFVKIGGKLIAYKAKVAQELEEAAYAIDILGGKVVDCMHYSLPKEMGERTIVILEKVKETPKVYPRGRGKERNFPLKRKEK